MRSDEIRQKGKLIAVQYPDHRPFHKPLRRDHHGVVASRGRRRSWYRTLTQFTPRLTPDFNIAGAIVSLSQTLTHSTANSKARNKGYIFVHLEKRKSKGNTKTKG